MPVVYDDRLEVFMMCKRVVLAVFLPALAMGTFAAQAQAQNQPASKSMDGMGQMGGMSMEHSMDKPALPAGSLKITFWDKSAEWTPASLAALPHKTVTVVNEHTKAYQSYSGVPLIDLLTRLGVPDNPHGLGLKVYLVAVGADGYRVVYSLAEVNPAFQQAPVIVADTLDGKPLAGNFQIVVTGEKGQSRWVRNLLAIHVMTVE
jgi:hypothetical protein